MNNSRFYKHPQYKHVYGEEITTPLARIVWPYLVTPKAPKPPKEGEAPREPKFEATLVIAKNGKDVEQFITVLHQMTTEMIAYYNEGLKAKLTVESFISDGDEFDLEKYPYYRGSFVLRATNRTRPKLFGRKVEEITPDTVKGGMLGVGLVVPLITSHGVSYQLRGLQLVKDDGVRIGGFQRDAKSQFVDWDTNEEASAPEEVPAEAPVKPKTTKSSSMMKAVNLV